MRWFGRVDAEDVQFILRKVGVGVTPLQAEDIVNSLSSEQNQLVYYDDLIMVLFNRANVNDNPLLESYGRGSPGGNNVQRMPMRPLATSMDPHSKSRIIEKQHQGQMSSLSKQYPLMKKVMSQHETLGNGGQRDGIPLQTTKPEVFGITSETE